VESGQLRDQLLELLGLASGLQVVLPVYLEEVHLLLLHLLHHLRGHSSLLLLLAPLSFPIFFFFTLFFFLLQIKGLLFPWLLLCLFFFFP
jgi:hypothetical protein